MLMAEYQREHEAVRDGQFLERDVVWIHNAPLRGMRRAVKNKKKEPSLCHINKYDIETILKLMLIEEQKKLIDILLFYKKMFFRNHDIFWPNNNILWSHNYDNTLYSKIQEG